MDEIVNSIRVILYSLLLYVLYNIPLSRFQKVVHTVKATWWHNPQNPLSEDLNNFHKYPIYLIYGF